ncbi:cysteine desulfurase [Nibricoccus aquaticus]|uniref:Cysteine desulfurase n=1 Tax=Nibricoccus aquaticus TaxID=2576891 RepID=A0A290Q9X4_9BACT|nr:aminotransferase class V-fold PLP-dependent enzyme [Nibricoccus aquaticus]ATC65233.1 cysteine desulfurase [Nibricoccus aquaticus]
MPYFDHNATAPLAPIARETWLRLSDEAWHNPSSPTRDGARARLRLDAARERTAEFLGCPPARLLFNSGATEGAHTVFDHWARTLPPAARIALNPTEHPAVLEAARRHFPDRIDFLPLTPAGLIRLDALATLFSSDTPPSALAVMAANNETGVLQPWREIAALCAARHIPFLCDATQWLGKLPASGLGATGWLIASAHKFGGPKATGLLVFPDQSESFSAQSGGSQENAHRAGTEDVPSICALAAALADAEQTKVFLEESRLHLRNHFERAIVSAITGSRILCPDADRLWNTISLLLPHVENARWVAKLDKRGFQVSTGSACATGKAGPSHVLTALGLSIDESRRVIRISSGWDTTESDWHALLAALTEVATELIPPANVVKP